MMIEILIVDLDILKLAHEKAGFSNDDFIVRLKAFPLVLLKNIILKDTSFLDDFENNYSKLIEKFEKATLRPYN